MKLSPILFIPAFTARFGNLRSDEITPAIISEVAEALGKPLAPAAAEAAAALLKSGGEEHIAKWIMSKENVDRLVAVFKPPEDPGVVLMACPHCTALIEVKLSEIVSH